MAKKKTEEKTVHRPADPNVMGLRGAVVEQPITRTLDENYMPYAMSVIVSRAIPETAFDLPGDHRHCIGGKTQPTIRVKAAQSLQQPQTGQLAQILLFNAAVSVAAGNGIGKGQVFLQQSRFLLRISPVHSPDPGAEILHASS